MGAILQTADVPAYMPAPVRSSDLGTFDLIRRWQDYLSVSGDVNPNTARQYRRLVLDVLAETLTDLRALSEDDVVRYLAAIPAQGGKRPMAMKALRSLYAWGTPRGQFDRDPVERMKVRKPKAGPAPRLSADDLERVLSAAESVDPRARWTLQLAYATGARIASLVAIRCEDVRLEPEPWLDFRVTKGDRPYGVPLGPRALEAVEHLLALRDYKPKMAVSRRDTLVGVGAGTVWQWAHRAGEMTGLHVWPHLLRHAFATRLADEGVDPRTFIELMNHADTSQLRRYAAPSDANLRAAVAVL